MILGCMDQDRWRDPSRSTPSISVVIANFNYERYVGQAIESALALDWPSVEVIVVDDGSTDGSLERIRSFEGRIRVIAQANAGQRVANNIGFAESSGEIIIFLDADDMLDPEIARKIAAVWTSRTSKVQVQMARVDAHGRPLGSVLPRLRKAPSPAQIRRWALESSEYPSPPGSGNAYSRVFLEAIFPIGSDRDAFTDSTCIAMAPFFGDVVTIAKPLVKYRIHGANDSDLLRDERNFAREVARAVKRLRAARDASRAQGHAGPRPDALFRGRHLLQLRLASMRLRPDEHPLHRDSRLRALGDAMLIPFRSGFEPFGRGLLIACWSALVATLPRLLARALIGWRFASQPPAFPQVRTAGPTLAENGRAIPT